MIKGFIQEKGKCITELTNSIVNFTSIRVVILRVTVNAITKVATVLSFNLQYSLANFSGGRYSSVELLKRRNSP
jgi:hypothetical protein